MSRIPSQTVKWVLMSTPPDDLAQPVRELPVVGGHLALDFANTIDDPLGPERFDHAGTYAGLLSWSVRVGCLSDNQAADLARVAADRPGDGAAALLKAHRLRLIIGTTFTDIARQPSSPMDHWTKLRPFVVDAVSRAQLTSEDQAYAFSWPDPVELDAMLWPVAQAAADLLTGPDLPRVKVCGGCPWLFVDRSKNQSRRWCAMEDCGTHEKIRRYVTRRAARRKD